MTTMSSLFLLEDQLINADRRWLGYMQKTQRPHKCIDESILQNAVHEKHQNERTHKMVRIVTKDYLYLNCKELFHLYLKFLIQNLM